MARPDQAPDPRGTLTPLKAKPDPGLRPPFQSRLNCTPRIITEGPGLGRASCPPRPLTPEVWEAVSPGLGWSHRPW